MIKNVGFTGTREAPTAYQLMRAAYWLDELKGSNFHFGDCVGADQITAEIARKLNYSLICHPPSKNTLRAFVDSDEYKKPQPYLERDRNIANISDVLIALPQTDQERVRSGTWATVRQARRQSMPVILIMPERERLERWRGTGK